MGGRHGKGGKGLMVIGGTVEVRRDGKRRKMPSGFMVVVAWWFPWWVRRLKRLKKKGWW